MTCSSKGKDEFDIVRRARSQLSMSVRMLPLLSMKVSELSQPLLGRGYINSNQLTSVKSETNHYNKNDSHFKINILLIYMYIYFPLCASPLGLGNS